ncbi:YbhB/YbcL family Raf kinase inhibitor-like protein, partial [bacterium M00.F.Ca.ET.141.01.1.1]
GGTSVSIALAWKDPPAGTKSYALTMFDPDANGGKGFWHWLAWNIPASAKGLAEGAGSKGDKRMPKGTVRRGRHRPRRLFRALPAARQRRPPLCLHALRARRREAAHAGQSVTGDGIGCRQELRA